MKQYEYNVLTNRYHIKEEVLNLLGKEGWELVSHTYTDKSQSIEDEHIYTFKREKIAYPKGIAERKFKLDDSFRKALEEAVVSDTPASSWMDEYYDDYIKLQASGMMFEFHPTWTGHWDRDKWAFCYDKKKSNQGKETVVSDTQRYDGVKAKTFIRDESGLDGNGGPEWKNMFWENPILYAKLEHMIMEWSNDETKTAGELTRSILKLIK